MNFHLGSSLGILCSQNGCDLYSVWSLSALGHLTIAMENILHMIVTICTAAAKWTATNWLLSHQW